MGGPTSLEGGVRQIRQISMADGLSTLKAFVLLEYYSYA